MYVSGSCLYIKQMPILVNCNLPFYSLDFLVAVKTFR
ncbi:hypothetical protein IMSAG192_00715 [Muribaculaceae bacterium]|nr:hypothetical protein IMSAG192_00715 [Muribaculaceae bacterium]